MNKTHTTFGLDQVAYPVGPNKDGYYIGTHFSLDTETNVVTSKSIAFKNFYSTSKCGELTRGTYKECYDYIQQIITPPTAEDSWDGDDSQQG
jgi:hypothetical protein